MYFKKIKEELDFWNFNEEKDYYLYNSKKKVLRIILERNKKVKWFTDVTDYELYRLKEVFIEKNCRFIVRRNNIGVEREDLKRIILERRK